MDERFPFGPFLGVEGVISMSAGRGQTGLGMKKRRRMRDQTRDQEKGGQTTEPKASIQRQRPLHREPERANSPSQKRPPVEAGAPALCPTVLVLLPGSRGAGVSGGSGKNEGREVQESLRRHGTGRHGARSRRRLGRGSGEGWTQPGWGPDGGPGTPRRRGRGRLGARRPLPASPPPAVQSRGSGRGGVSRLTLPYLRTLRGGAA